MSININHSDDSVSTTTGTIGGVSQQVAGITALRGISPVANRVIYLKYHTTAGDGGHGNFRAVTGAAPGTYVDNGGTIIVPTGGDGSAAWLRDFVGAVRPEWFGASTGDSYAAYNLAKEAASAILISKSSAIGTNINLSAVELIFEKGGQLLPSVGVTITVGPIKAGLYQIFGDTGTIIATRKTREVYPEWWGAPGGNTNNNSAGIQAAHDACVTNGVLVHMSDKYGIGTKINWSNSVPILADMGSTWEAYAACANCVDVSDGNFRGRSVFPLINGFSGYGMKIKGTNAANIYIPAITNCGDGLILETVAATHPNLLDTNVEFQQIGLCTRGVVWSADATANVMQGNLVLGNFISGTDHSVEFANNGLGATPNWDSNKLVLQATDPTIARTTAKVLYNPNTYAISRFTFRVESWAGGMASTAMFIDGKFNDLDLYLNLAQSPTDGQFMLVGTQNRADVSSADGRTDASVACATVAASKATFNGGQPLFRNREKLQAVPATDWVANTTRAFYAYHALTDGNSNVMRICAPEAAVGATILPVRVFDNSLTNANEVQITFVNLSGATIAAGTVCEFILEVGR